MIFGSGGEEEISLWIKRALDVEELMHICVYGTAWNRSLSAGKGCRENLNRSLLLLD